MQQPLIGERGKRLRIERTRVHRIFDKPLVHRGRAPHRVVPVHVPIHLVACEEQRLERGQSLFHDPDLPAVRGVDDCQRVEKAIDIDLAIGDAAHERVAA